MAYFVNWEPKGVYAKFFDICTVDDVFHAYEKISGNSHPNDIRDVIFDYLNVEQHNISDSEIVKVAAFDIGLANFYPSLRFASVAIDKRVLESWRHFEDVVKISGRHAVFPTVSAARDWLAASQPTPNYFRSSCFQQKRVIRTI